MHQLFDFFTSLPLQTFWFLSYFPEPLSLTAQSLLARDRANPARAAHWARLLLRCALLLLPPLLECCCCSCGGAVRLLGHLPARMLLHCTCLHICLPARCAL